MVLRFIVIISFLSLATSLNAKSSILKDTYAFTRGVEAFNEWKYDDAMDWFIKELSDHPNNGYAYFYISILHSADKEYGKALTAIDNAIKNIPKKDKEWEASAFAARSDIYTELGDTLKALNDLTKAIQINPTNSKLFNARAQLNYELKNYDLSDADYQKAIDLDQGDVMGYLGIGRNANAQERWDEAIKQFNQVIKLSPDYSSGYSFRAEAYIGLQKWAEATDDIVKASDIDVDDKAFYLMISLPQEAASLLKSKLQIQMVKQPSNRYWAQCLGAVAYSNHEWDEAITYYEKANKIDAHPLLLGIISECYGNKGDYSKALDYVERALNLTPDDYNLIELKALILSNLGRFEECLVERDKYVAKYPDDYASYLNRAGSRLDSHKFNDAIEDYNTAIVLAPYIADQPYFLVRRGDAYRLSGKLEEAFKDYRHLLEYERDSVLSTKSLIPFAYSGLGEAEKAIESLQYIISNDTTDINGTLYDAACIYARLNKTTEAFQYLNAAIDNGYNNLVHIELDYDLDCLRSFPEYEQILKRVTLMKEEAEECNELAIDDNMETAEIPFTKENGVTKVLCSINGLPLHFVFDTGAADVTMSLVEANFMLKNGYIKPTDIIGNARYMDANGDITEGTVINIRSVNFGGLELENVRASVVRNQKAPLLLGQSVLGRLGKFEIDNSNMKLLITHIVQEK